jgi:predicted hydrolase (HD superfamily)
MKDKAFARAVSREEIVQGAQELTEVFDEHVVFVARALQAAPELGLGRAEAASG